METGIIELAAQYGLSGGLLLLIMFWLARHYLPEQQKQQRADMERILSAHDRCIGKLASAIERNTRVMQFNSQALLVQSMIRGGLSREEAEQIAESIKLSALNGLGKPPHSGRSAA